MNHSATRIFSPLSVALLLASASCSEGEESGPTCGLPDSVPADVPEFHGASCEGVVPPTFAELQAGFSVPTAPACNLPK